MPIYIHSYTFMYLDSPIILAGLPIPKPQLSISITRSQELAIRTKLKSTGIPLTEMTRKDLFTILLKTAFKSIISDYLVIHRLAKPVVTTWVHRWSRNRVHVSVADVLRNYWDAELPEVDLLIFSSRDKSLTIVDEGNSVDATQVFLVLLNDVFRIRVVLQNLFVVTTSQEDVLFVVLRMELDTQWRFTVEKCAYHLSRFRVPEMDCSIEGSTQEFSAVVGETNVSDGFVMTGVSSQTFPMGQYIPYFAGTVMTCRKHKMTKLWKKSYLLNSLGMALKCVHPLLRDITLIWLTFVCTF